jgi:hypothetical protein
MAGIEAPWELMGAHRRGEGEEGQGGRPRGAARGSALVGEGARLQFVSWLFSLLVSLCCA